MISIDLLHYTRWIEDEAVIGLALIESFPIGYFVVCLFVE